jgi:hypothetical protein
MEENSKPLPGAAACVFVIFAGGLFGKNKICGALNRRDQFGSDRNDKGY